MSADQIYVQVTASSESSGKSRTAIVRVPRANIEKYRQEKNDFHSDENAVAKALAEPLAAYVFTHRSIFSTYTVAYFYSSEAPPEIEGLSANVSQAGIRAWVTS